MTMVISSSPASRYISSINCMCCVTLLNRKPKEAANQLTESTTSVRGKRSGGHCLFRHCGGIVCADKLAKRRRNKLHRVHLRLSQDIVSDHWKICNVTSSAGAIVAAQIVSNTVENVNEEKGETANEYCKASSENSMENEKDVSPIKEETAAPKTDDKTESFSDWNVCKMCARVSTAKSSPRNVTEAKISGDIRGNDSPKGIAEDAQRDKISSEETRGEHAGTDIRNHSSGTIKKHSQSDSSFNDAIIKAHCTVDSVLYRELRTKCVPATEKRLPVDRSAEISNLKRSVERLRSTSRVQKRVHRKVEIESSFPTAWQRGTTNQKKFPCENSFRDTKTCRNSSPWYSARRDSMLKFNPCFVEPQCRILATSWRSKKNAYPRVNARKSADSAFDRKLICETRCAKYKPRLARCKEKPTVVIYKNERSNESREEMRCDDSTRSAYSSTTSTEFAESSVDGNRVACRCPSYCTTTTTDRYKRSRCNTRVFRNSLSSSSSLSSFNRHRHWTMLSQDSIYQKRKPISSFCTNVQACAKRCSRNKKRPSTYPSSTLSSSSSTSLSTFTEDLEITDRTVYPDDRLFGEVAAASFEESKKCQRLWKNYREQATKRTVYTDERRVTWDIKRPC